MSSDSNITLSVPGIHGAPLEASLLTVATVLTVAGNLATLAAFATDRSLRQKSSNLYLASLSFADLLMGLVVLPLRALETGFGYWPLGEALCMVETFFANIALTVAIYTITLISVDRFLLVSKDYSKYLAIMSQKVVRWTIFAVWTSVCLSSLLEMVLWSTDAIPPPFPVNFDYICLPPVKLNQAFLMVIFVSGFFIPLSIMTVCSLGFMFYLRRRLKGKIHAAGESSTAQSDVSGTGGPSRTAWTTAGPTGRATLTTHGPAPPGQPSTNGATGPEASNDGAAPRETRRKATLRNRYLKPAITMAALLVVFIACTLPYLIIAAIISPICPTCYSYKTRVHVANLLFANSCINPILYAATQSKIRQFYRTYIFSCCRRRR